MSLLTSVAAVLFLAGAHPGGAGWALSPGASFELLAGETVLRARFDASGLTGEGVALRHTDEALRGRVLGREVAIRWKGRQLVGRVGGEATRLHIDLGRGVARARGVFAGHESELLWGPRGIKGRIGGCTYTLEAASQSYLGVRVCAGPVQPIPTALVLPRDFEALSEVEQLALLAVVLSAAPVPVR